MNDAERLERRARFYQANGDHEQAREIFAELVSVNPTAELFARLGRECQAIGNYSAAIGAYHRALELDETHLETLSALGEIQTQLGRPALAARVYTYMAQHHPELPQAHANLGNALARQNRYEEAESCYIRAIGISADFPGFDRVLYNLARVYALSNRSYLAIRMLFSASDRNPRLALDGMLDPAFDSVRESPDLQVLREIALPELFVHLQRLLARKQLDELRADIARHPFVQEAIRKEKPFTRFRVFLPRESVPSEPARVIPFPAPQPE